LIATNRNCTVLGRFLLSDVTHPADFVGPDLVSGRMRVGGHTGNSRPDTRSGPTHCVTSVIMKRCYL
jgi:hypothetical protein